MDCNEARSRIHDFGRRRLDPAQQEAVARHLEGCAACRRANEAEALLDRLLQQRLPRHAAPPELRRRLESLAAGGPPNAVHLEPPAPAPLPIRRRASRWTRPAALALAASLALVSGAVLVTQRTGRERFASLAGEAVSDHMRVLASAHPLDVESSGSHEVKPWFEGKLDFAPQVPPDGGDLRLRGGAVGYFLDRKAAVISYTLRKHVLTLVVFPDEGLPWPAGGSVRLGGVEAFRGSSRGFHAVLWRSGGLGYALVSDVDPRELDEIAAKFAAAR